MTNIKSRLEKLEAVTPVCDTRITEIHRVIVGQFNEDGSPVIIVHGKVNRIERAVAAVQTVRAASREASHLRF